MEEIRSRHNKAQDYEPYKYLGIDVNSELDWSNQWERIQAAQMNRF